MLGACHVGMHHLGNHSKQGEGEVQSCGMVGARFYWRDGRRRAYTASVYLPAPEKTVSTLAAAAFLHPTSTR